MRPIVRLWSKGHSLHLDESIMGPGKAPGMRSFLMRLTHPQPKCACTRPATDLPKLCPCPTKYPHRNDPYGEPKVDYKLKGLVWCYCCDWCRTQPECIGH